MCPKTESQSDTFQSQYNFLDSRFEYLSIRIIFTFYFRSCDASQLTPEESVLFFLDIPSSGITKPSTPLSTSRFDVSNFKAVKEVAPYQICITFIKWSCFYIFFEGGDPSLERGTVLYESLKVTLRRVFRMKLHMKFHT